MEVEQQDAMRHKGGDIAAPTYRSRSCNRRAMVRVGWWIAARDTATRLHPRDARAAARPRGLAQDELAAKSELQPEPSVRARHERLQRVRRAAVAQQRPAAARRAARRRGSTRLGRGERMRAEIRRETSSLDTATQIVCGRWTRARRARRRSWPGAHTRRACSSFASSRARRSCSPRRRTARYGSGRSRSARSGSSDTCRPR